MPPLFCTRTRRHHYASAHSTIRGHVARHAYARHDVIYQCHCNGSEEMMGHCDIIYMVEEFVTSEFFQFFVTTDLSTSSLAMICSNMICHCWLNYCGPEFSLTRKSHHPDNIFFAMLEGSVKTEHLPCCIEACRLEPALSCTITKNLLRGPYKNGVSSPVPL